MKVRHKRLVRGVSIAVALGLACAGLLTGVAGAQTDAAPGVTDKEIKLGYISSQTGAAASIYKNAHKACQARVGAQNAKGGVNGRKIGLEIIDDQSGPGNLTAAQDLIQNRKVFAVIDNSALAFLAWRYIKDAGVPMIGPGFEGNYYLDKANETVISGIGNQATVPGLTYDTPIRVMKKLGATKVASLGYAASPTSSAAATATNEYAAPSLGLTGAYVNNTLDFGVTDVGPIVLAMLLHAFGSAYCSAHRARPRRGRAPCRARSDSARPIEREAAAENLLQRGAARAAAALNGVCDLQTDRQLTGHRLIRPTPRL